MGDIEAILADHASWLAGTGGACADLSHADLRSANLLGADVRVASLRNADLRYADLRYADLRVASLRGADLCGANLRGANLCYADLCGADLGGADLRESNLCGALLPDGYTVSPVGLWTALIRAPEGRLDIGCQSHTFDYWREHLVAIAASVNATEGAISVVRRILEECNV